jgi:hypothetical protein
MNRFVVAIVMLLQTLATAVIVTACSTVADHETAKLPEEGAPDAAVLPVMRPAPAWDNEDWINSEVPILLEDLHGKAVLLAFSTSL